METAQEEKACTERSECKNKGKNYIRFDWAIKRLLRNKKVEDLPEAERKAYYRHLDQVSYEEGVIEHNRSEAKMEGEKIGLEKGEAIGLEKGEQERLKLEQRITELEKLLESKTK